MAPPLPWVQTGTPVAGKFCLGRQILQSPSLEHLEGLGREAQSSSEPAVAKDSEQGRLTGTLDVSMITGRLALACAACALRPKNNDLERLNEI